MNKNSASTQQSTEIAPVMPKKSANKKVKYITVFSAATVALTAIIAAVTLFNKKYNPVLIFKMATAVFLAIIVYADPELRLLIWSLCVELGANILTELSNLWEKK